MERLQYAIFFIAILFIGFVAGSAVMLFKVFPYDYFHNAYVAANALIEQASTPTGLYQTDLWQPARNDHRGVVIDDPGSAYAGYTLYTSGHAQTTFLIDMKGNVVHKWHLPYREFWDSSAAEKSPKPPEDIFIMRAYVYPNGDLLALYIGTGDTPWGYGLVKMDKDSHLIWKYMQHTHHDLDVGQDGRIYVLTQEISHRRFEDHRQLVPPRIDDFVVVLSPQGKQLKKVSLLEALIHSRYSSLLAQLPWFTMNGKGDYLHTNSVQVLEGEAAKNFPFAKAGDVLVSFRELNTLAVVDLDQEKIVWALRGSWIGQHDPRILPNGDILLFDNNGHFAPGGASRVIEVDPKTEAIVWSYSGDEAHPFHSVIRSGQQRLPNGNTLITESDGGRIFEVTPADKIVWEYVNPVRGGPDDRYIPVLSRASRHAASYFDSRFLQDIQSGAASRQSGG